MNTLYQNRTGNAPAEKENPKWIIEYIDLIKRRLAYIEGVRGKAKYDKSIQNIQLNLMMQLEHLVNLRGTVGCSIAIKSYFRKKNLKENLKEKHTYQSRKML